MNRQLLSRLVVTLFAGLLAGFVSPPLLRAQCDGGGAGPQPLGPLPPYCVTVTPDGLAGPNRAVNSSGHSETFWVTNIGTNADTYTMTCWGTSGITCTGVNPASLALAGGTQATVSVSYNVGAAGSGQLWVRAAGSASDTGHYVITIGAPVVDASPYNWAKQDYGRCAEACFAATYAQGTVPYVSRDAPRNVVLVYNGDRLNPKPFVHVNVSPDPGTAAPSEYRLQVKVNGAFVTFVNGEQLLRFAYPGAFPARIGGQWTSALATGSYPMEIHVTGLYGAVLRTNVTTTTLIQVNETTAPIAKGWTLGGIQRAFTTSAGVLITEGDGSAVHFTSAGGGLFTSPSGEFSSLVTGTPSGGAGFTRRFPDSTKVVFNSAGRMIEVRDRFTNITTVTYDASNRVSQVKDPLNLAITLTYNSNGLATITDPGGRVTTVTVNASKRLTTIRDPDLVSTTFSYDASEQLTGITNRRGHTTTFGYHALSGKVATVTAPTISYVGTNGADSTGSPVTTLAPWQRQGVPYGGTGTPVAAPAADTVYGRVTDAGGHFTRFTVNRWGTPQQITDPLGFVTRMTFNANGLPIRTVYRVGLPDSLADSVVYNASGLPTYVRAAGRDSAAYIRYAAWAQADSIWGYQLPPVRHFIGTNGRVDSTRTWGVSGAGVTRFIYWTGGRVERVTDGEGHLAMRTWYLGTNGNRSRDSVPGGRQTTYSYDTHGRSTSISAPGVSSRFTAYDVLNRVLKDSIAGSVPTIFAYDSLFLKSVTDPKGQIYRFAYNALGWATAHTDPANRADTLRYSREGLVRRAKNRRGQTVEYVYDAGHRVTGKSGTNTDATSWGYSADGRIVRATSPWAVDSQFFNTSGKLDSVRTKLASQTFTQRLRYTTVGALDSVTITGGGVTFLARKYIWNAQSGSLSSIRLGGGGNTSLIQNKDQQLTSTVLPGADAIARAYTSVHAEAQISTAAPYAISVSRYLNFDVAGRISRQVYGSGIAGRAFYYDGQGRLVADSQIADQGPTNPCEEPNIIDENGNQCTYMGTWVTVPAGSVTFGYDAAGNRTDQSGSYGSANRIRQFAGCSYVTDSLGDGNVVSRTCGSEVIRFWWTAESRLAALKLVGGDSLDFRYDAGGRLARKDVNTVAQAYFLWQGDNLLAELNATATGKVAEYSYYPGLDNPHAVITGTTPNFAHVDGIGNVIALTDSAKTVQRVYDYDAWGGPRGANGFNADRARFKGALWLGPQVDVYYMRNRWYEPKSGRFLSEDPLGVSAGTNPYVYAGDDPVNRRDPTGLCAEGEELWAVFFDSDGDGQLSAGDKIIGYYCKSPGGGSGRARPGQVSQPVSPDACPAPPPAPPSADLGRDIKKGHTFRVANGLPLNVHGHILFTAAVWDGGVMDYKTFGDEYDAYGNFTYGAVGSATGYTENILMRMSGWAHYKFDLNQSPSLGRALAENPPPYWDNPTDRGNITAGIQYYQNGCHNQ